MICCLSPKCVTEILGRDVLMRSGLEDGDLVITTPMGVPKEGVKVTVRHIKKQPPFQNEANQTTHTS